MKINKSIQMTFFAISLFVSSVANADCFFNGVFYPEGAVINGLTCINGQWR